MFAPLSSLFLFQNLLDSRFDNPVKFAAFEQCFHHVHDVFATYSEFTRLQGVGHDMSVDLQLVFTNTDKADVTLRPELL